MGHSRLIEGVRDPAVERFDPFRAEVSDDEERVFAEGSSESGQRIERALSESILIAFPCPDDLVRLRYIFSHDHHPSRGAAARTHPW
jgi:hypothetical protein